MEENRKQHIIVPTQGICNTPSELTCKDEQLSECEGMTVVNGELMPVQKASQMNNVNISGELLHVHYIDKDKKYIFKKDSSLYYDAKDTRKTINIFFDFIKNSLNLYSYDNIEKPVDINIKIPITKEAVMASPIYYKEKSQLAVSKVGDDGEGVIACEKFTQYKTGTNYYAYFYDNTEYVLYIKTPKTVTKYTIRCTVYVSYGNVNDDYKKNIEIQPGEERIIPIKGFSNTVTNVICAYATRAESLTTLSTITINNKEEAYRYLYFDNSCSKDEDNNYIPKYLTNLSLSDECECNGIVGVQLFKEINATALTYKRFNDTLIGRIDYTDFENDTSVARSDIGDIKTVIADSVMGYSYLEETPILGKEWCIDNGEQITIDCNISTTYVGTGNIEKIVESTVSDENWELAEITSVKKQTGDKTLLSCIFTDTPFSQMSASKGDEYNHIEESIKIYDFEGATVKQVTSIGNTLVVNTEGGIHYFLYKNGKYIHLGKGLPEIDVQINRSITGDFMIGTIEDRYAVGVSLDNSDKLIYNTSEAFNAMIGAYSEAKNKVNSRNEQVGMFFIRLAIELYDGTYVMATSPILVPSHFKHPGYIATTKQGGYISFNIPVIKTILSQNTDYSDYSDIVRNIVVFESKAVDTQITTYKNDNHTVYRYEPYQTYPNGGLVQNNYNNAVTFNGGQRSSTFIISSQNDNPCVVLQMLEPKSNDAIQDELIDSSSNFYKVCELGIRKCEKVAISNITRDGVISNLVQQVRLTDGYYDHCDIIPDKIYVYNRRLLATGAKRTFFKGHKYFLSWNPLTPGYGLIAKVYINTAAGTEIVYQNIYYLKKNTPWFFYPDTRAYKAEIFGFVGKDSSDNYNSAEYSDRYIYCTMDLKQHPYLNGAYFLEISDNTIYGGDEHTTGLLKYEQPDESGTEYIGNFVLQSSVNNPWNIQASGYTYVGQSDVIGIAGLTTALSNNAYKVSTTLCFTQQGIWALLANGEGQFINVPPAFSREVCNNPNSITMVDNGVFFTSERGLMYVSGITEDAVLCVSEQMSGKGNKEFLDFIKTCRIAYDYTDRCIILFNTDKTYVWIYNIKSSAFSKRYKYLGTTTTGMEGNEVTIDNKIHTVVEDYPDSIMQDDKYKLYSLYNNIHRDADTNTYSATITSRALKLDGSMYLKSLRRLKAVMMLNENATCTIEMYGTNDISALAKPLTAWHKIASLKGKPYRFFKYKITFANLKATDSFSGLYLETQTRYTDRPH